MAGGLSWRERERERGRNIPHPLGPSGWSGNLAATRQISDTAQGSTGVLMGTCMHETRTRHVPKRLGDRRQT